MVVVSEEVCREVVSQADALDAVQAVFAGTARGDARNLPAVGKTIPPCLCSIRIPASCRHWSVGQLQEAGITVLGLAFS